MLAEELEKLISKTKVDIYIYDECITSELERII